MGQWKQISDALYATHIHHCDFCGKMMVKRLWCVEYEGKPLRFCDERCEYTWFDYWLPRYGKSHGFKTD
jgi:ribosomal protein L24E